MTDTPDDNAAMNLLIRGRAGPEQEGEQDDQQEPVVPSFDGGARAMTPRPMDMNKLIRDWRDW